MYYKVYSTLQTLKTNCICLLLHVLSSSWQSSPLPPTFQLHLEGHQLPLPVSPQIRFKVSELYFYVFFILHPLWDWKFQLLGNTATTTFPRLCGACAFNSWAALEGFIAAISWWKELWSKATMWECHCIALFAPSHKSNQLNLHLTSRNVQLTQLSLYTYNSAKVWR